MPLRLLIVLFCVPLWLGAQADSATISRLQLGIGGGFLQHEVDFTPFRAIEPLEGNNYCLSLRYFDNNLVGFQAELGYSQAGWRDNLDPALAELYERRVDYVELLLLTQFSIGRGAVQPMLQAGPYVSFPLSSAEDIPLGFEDPATTLPNVVGFDFPGRLNYGAQVGVGLNVELGPLTLQAEGRYLIGFSDLFKNGTTTASTSRRAGLGVHFGVFYAIANSDKMGARAGAVKR